MKSSIHIVGNGLIAKSLVNATFNRNTLVLASGVSNSLEKCNVKFYREYELVRKEITSHPEFHVIYCSTCSVENGETSPYISHKKCMEQLVRDLSTSFHICRLPQVVGLVRNSTLVSFLVDSILHDRKLNVQARATRNLLDIADFARILTTLVNQEFGYNTVQNIASTNSVPVIAIVEEIARLLSRSPQIVMSETGYSQEINIDFLKGILPTEDPILQTEYWQAVLQHYVPMYLLDL